MTNAGRFRFDANAELYDEITPETTGEFVYDLLEGSTNTTLEKRIDEQSKLAIPDAENEFAVNFERTAFSAGALAVIEAFDYSDIPIFHRNFVINAFKSNNNISDLNRDNPSWTAEQFETSALLGMSNHPELNPIVRLISTFYVVNSFQVDTYENRVFLGAGRTAFLLDKYFDLMCLHDPQFTFDREIASTDWDKFDWAPLLNDPQD